MLSTLTDLFIILQGLVLLAAVWQDIRRRLIDDSLILILGILGISIFILHGIQEGRLWLIRMLPAVLSILLLTYLFWRLGVWADGDALIIPFLALSFPTPFTVLSLPFTILLAGGILALISIFLLLIREKQRIPRYAWLWGSAAAAPLLALIPFNPFLALGSFLLMSILVTLSLTARIIEEKLFTKRIPLAQVIPGDWVIAVERHGRRDAWPLRIGITSQQIRHLKEEGITHLWIREGIPFLPAIFLGTLVSWLLYTYKPLLLGMLAWL